MSGLKVSVAIVLLALAACGSLSPSRVAEPTDPDRSAEELTAAWEQAVLDANDPQIPPEDRVSLRLAKTKILYRAEVLALEHPRHAPTLMLCAALSHDQKRSDNALAFLGSLLDVEPQHAEAAILRSRIALEQGNHPYAIRMLSEQINFHPDHAGVYEARAAALFLAERLIEARRDLHTAERLGAPVWRVAYNRGLVAEAENRPEAALNHYNECLSARPDFTPAQERVNGIRALGLNQMLIPK